MHRPGEVGRRLLLIHKPLAGARRRGRLRDTMGALEHAGATMVVRETACRGDAERLAAGADAALFDAVVVAGGDGTINEAINGLMAREPERRPLPLGIIPLGTANVLAGELGVPTEPLGTAAVLAAGPVRGIRLGTANGRCFAMMAGVGLDARVVEALGYSLKRLAGRTAYTAEALRQIVRSPPGPYRVEIEGEVAAAGSVVIAKGHFYGGRFVCAPAADLGEPTLHACLFPVGGRLTALRAGAAVVLGRLPALAGYRIVPCREVRVTGATGEGVQGDGDIIAHLPLVAAVAPRPLPVLAPPFP